MTETIHFGTCGVAACDLKDVPTSLNMGEVTCDRCWAEYRMELRAKHDHKPEAHGCWEGEG